MTRPGLTYALHSAILALLIFIISSSSIALTRFEGGAAFIWPATAPLLAFIALRAPREWPLPTLAAGCAVWLASAIFGLGPWAAFPLAAASMSEAVMAATLLRRVRSDFSTFDRLSSLGLFVIAAGIIAPALSGLLAAWAIVGKTHQSFWPNWLAWFAAHGLGTITFSPLLLFFFGGEGLLWIRRATTWRRIEALSLLAFVAFVSFIVFDQERLPMLFLPLFPIMVTTFRLGRIGAASSVVILATIGGILTLQGHGPVELVRGSDGLRAQYFQFYLAFTVLMVLVAAAELKQRNALMLRSLTNEASYRLLAEKLGDTIIHTDLSGNIRFVSPAITELIGYVASDVVGRNSAEFILNDDLAVVEAARADAVSDSGRTVSVQYRVRTRNNDIIWCEANMRSYLDPEGSPAGVILVVRNASTWKEAEARLSWEATTDHLTGLPNRRAFLSRLDQALTDVSTGPGMGCVAMLDVDYFKRVNDGHGHATGDLVLKAIATATQDALRSSDMVARLGGEEFGLVLWGASVEQATATCERVRDAVAKCSVQSPSGVHILVTASLGLTQMEPGRTSGEICDRADRMLYVAKAEGRNRVLVAA